MAIDSSGNPKVDFAWGNAPLQPNDDRTVPGVTGYFTNSFVYNSSPNVWAFTGKVTGLAIGDSFVISQHLNPDFNITYEVISFDGDTTVVTNQYFETSGPTGNTLGCRWDKVVENQQVVETIGGGEGDYGWAPTQTKSSLQLDPALDNHLLATGYGEQAAGYAGYPGFLLNDPDNVPNTVVPDLSHATLAQATELLTNANLVLGTVQDDEEGGNDGNDGTVKTQSYQSGSVVNEGTVVNITLFHVHLYTITFNENGGQGYQNTKTVRATSPSFVLPAATFTRSNYSFVGWSNNKNAAEVDALPAGSTVQSVSSDITYYAIWHALLPTLSGGNQVGTDGTYVYRAFTSSQDFVVSGGLLHCDLLVVAGGGNGGYWGGGGGGAGGVLYYPNASIGNGTYPVVVGAGGGNASSIGADLLGVIASGGGYGGTWVGGVGGDGGSGGGGTYDENGGSGINGQGYEGGYGFRYYSSVQGGGGGGAGEPGRSFRGTFGNSRGQANYAYSSKGGDGITAFSDWLNMFGLGQGASGARWIAGGGAGNFNGFGGYPGGLGGGGNSGYAGSDGTANTGGGGGAGGGNPWQGYGGAGQGGSGLVIVRYLASAAQN